MRVAIAGGGTGIGAACARLLVRAGAQVFASARTLADLDALQEACAQGPGVLHTLAADLSTDVGAEAFARGAFEALGGLEAGLVCVGAAHPAVRLAEATRALLHEQLEQHTIAAALSSGALVRAWERQPGPRGPDRQLLVLSSLATQRPPLPGTGPYTLAKAAVEALVRGLAAECWPLRVNALCLGPVATRLHLHAGTPAQAIARFPTPDQVAPLIVQLLGDQAPQTSGRCFDAEALGLDADAALHGSGGLAFVAPLQPVTLDEPAAPEAEPGRRPSPRVLRALRASAASVQVYPRDHDLLVRRLAGLHGVAPGQVVLSGGGATELLERCLRALCTRGDEVLSPFPTFEVLSALCSREGLRHRPVPSRTADGLFAPLSAKPLLAALGPRTRLVYVATPDNPTGAVLDDAELRTLLRGLPRGVPLVLDEAWSLAAPAPLGDEGALVRLRSFSKLFGLAGLRLGYALAPPGLASLLHRLALPYPLGAPQLAAALAALDELPRARKAALLLRRTRGRVADGLRALGLLVNESPSPVLLVRDPRRKNLGPLLFALRAAEVPVQEAHWDPAALVLATGDLAHGRRLLAAARRALAPGGAREV